jgi:hypothetical protein
MSKKKIAKKTQVEEPPISTKEHQIFNLKGKAVSGFKTYNNRRITSANPFWAHGCIEVDGEIYPCVDNLENDIIIGESTRGDWIEWWDYTTYSSVRRPKGISAGVVNLTRNPIKPVGNTNPNPPNGKKLTAKQLKDRGEVLKIPKIQITSPGHLKGLEVFALFPVILEEQRFESIDVVMNTTLYFDLIPFSKDPENQPNKRDQYVAVNVRLNA